MGKPKGGKSNHRPRKRTTSHPPSKTPDPDADALVIELSAGENFYSALTRKGEPQCKTAHGASVLCTSRLLPAPPDPPARTQTPSNDQDYTELCLVREGGWCG